MSEKKIGFIGVGNMASAMIRGMLSSGVVAPENVCGSCLHVESAHARASELGVRVGTSNAVVVKNSDVVFLTCKPYQLADVLAGDRGVVAMRDNSGDDQMVDILSGGQAVRELFDANKLIVSAVAGVSMDSIFCELNGLEIDEEGNVTYGNELECDGGTKEQQSSITEYKIIRCMPNTPAFVGAGTTSYCANCNVTPQDLELVEQLLGSFGTVERVTEEQMDAVTAVGGSAPAFVYAFIEALADGGVAEGLPRATAQRIAAQTVLGSAKMVLESDKHPAVLKDEVCSPAGTTIRGMEALERRAFRGTVIDAVRAAASASRGSQD